MEARSLDKDTNDETENSLALNAVKNLWERFQDWIQRSGKKPKIGLALGSGGARVSLISECFLFFRN